MQTEIIVATGLSTPALARRSALHRDSMEDGYYIIPASSASCANSTADPAVSISSQHKSTSISTSDSYSSNSSNRSTAFTAAAFAECHRASIKVVMITGDHTKTAPEIHTLLGLNSQECENNPGYSGNDSV